MRQVAGLSPRDLQAMQRSLSCRESVVYIIVTLDELAREQAFFPSLAIRVYGLQRRSILRNENQEMLVLLRRAIRVST
jgi:hypothetical protein